MGAKMDKQSKVLYFSTVGVLVVGLCFAVIGPLLLNKPAQQEALPISDAVAAISDPILDFQRERAQIREHEREALQALIDDGGTEAALRAEATARLMQLLKWSEQEVTLEGILRARGYVDAMVTVHQDSCNVVVRGQELTRAQSAQVLELVSRETGLMGGDIKIIPIPQTQSAANGLSIN